jgi:plasmid replication initiation protein
MLNNKLEKIIARIEAKSKARKEEDSFGKDAAEYGRDLIKNSVTKSNVLVRGYYRFSLIEKRVMEALISQLNPISTDKSKLQEIELKAVDYAKTFNVPEKHSYEHLESAITGLMHRVFSVSDPGMREEFTLMSNAKYMKGEGCISCSFNPYVVPHLIGLKQKFSKYPLRITANFKSSYTWRLYELLVSWAQDPKLTEGIFAGWFTSETNELRKMLGVPDSYRWSDFKRQVLENSEIELREKANIELKFEVIKTGRKITHLKFIFAEIKESL